MPTISFANGLDVEVDLYEVQPAPESPQNTLTYGKLDTLAKGATKTIQASSAQSELQAMRTGRIPSLNNNYYHQFPVAELAASGSAFTLTAAMQQGMEQAFQFIKYVQANADSKTAKDFRKALASTTDQKTAVNTFFKSTGSFQQCTLASWTAVLSWQTQFTSAWQGTYYLYSVADDSATPRSASALVATLVIASSADADSATLTMADASGTATPVAMAGDGSLQEQDAGTGSLLVALTPVWMSVTQTSQQDGKPVTSYRIGAAFAGTINGVQVAGNLNQLAALASKTSDKDSTGSTTSGSTGSGSTSSSSPDSWDSLHLSETIISGLAVLVAALAGIGTFLIGVKQYNLVKKQIAGDTANKDEIAKLEARLKTLETAKPLLESRVLTLENELPRLYLEVNQAETNQEVIEALITGVKRQITDSLKSCAPTNEVETLTEQMLKLQTNVRESNNGLSEKLKSLDTSIRRVIEENANTLREEVYTQMKETQEAVSKLAEQVESVREVQQERAEAVERDPSEEIKDDFKDAETQVETVDGKVI